MECKGRVGEIGKSKLEPARSCHPKVKQPKLEIGSHARQLTCKKASSGALVEVDHMSPGSLHQAIGYSMKGGAAWTFLKHFQP